MASIILIKCEDYFSSYLLIFLKIKRLLEHRLQKGFSSHENHNGRRGGITSASGKRLKKTFLKVSFLIFCFLYMRSNESNLGHLQEQS